MLQPKKVVFATLIMWRGREACLRKWCRVPTNLSCLFLAWKYAMGCKNGILRNVGKLCKSLTASNISLMSGACWSLHTLSYFILTTNLGDLNSTGKENEALWRLMDPIPNHIADKADQTLDSRHITNLILAPYHTSTRNSFLHVFQEAWSFPSYFVFFWKQPKKNLTFFSFFPDYLKWLKIQLGKSQHPHFWQWASHGHHKEICICWIPQMYPAKLEQGASLISDKSK